MLELERAFATDLGWDLTPPPLALPCPIPQASSQPMGCRHSHQSSDQATSSLPCRHQPNTDPCLLAMTPVPQLGHRLLAFQTQKKGYSLVSFPFSRLIPYLLQPLGCTSGRVRCEPTISAALCACWIHLPVRVWWKLEGLHVTTAG